MYSRIALVGQGLLADFTLQVEEKNECSLVPIS